MEKLNKKLIFYNILARLNFANIWLLTIYYLLHGNLINQIIFTSLFILPIIPLFILSCIFYYAFEIDGVTYNLRIVEVMGITGLLIYCIYPICNILTLISFTQGKELEKYIKFSDIIFYENYFFDIG